MKKILILGASSPTGKVFLNHIIKSFRDLDITCYVRFPEKLSSFKNLNIIKGDVTDQINLSNSINPFPLISISCIIEFNS